MDWIARLHLHLDFVVHIMYCSFYVGYCLLIFAIIIQNKLIPGTSTAT